MIAMSKPIESKIGKRLYEIDDSDIVAGTSGDIGGDTGGDAGPAGKEVAVDSDDSILVAYYLVTGDDVDADGSIRAEVWSDGVWRVTAMFDGKREPVMPEYAEHLNVAFEPRSYSSARWDSNLKAADEAAKWADSELVLGDEYRREPAEPGEGIVY
jgi:hypothetical protein